MYIWLLDILRQLNLTGRLNKPCEMSPVLVCFLNFTWCEDLSTNRTRHVPLMYKNGCNRGETRCMDTTQICPRQVHRTSLGPPLRPRREMKSGSVPQVPVMSPFTGWLTGTSWTGPLWRSAGHWVRGASWWAAGSERGRCSRMPVTAASLRPAQEVTCLSWTSTSVSEVSGSAWTGESSP